MKCSVYRSAGIGDGRVGVSFPIGGLATDVDPRRVLMFAGAAGLGLVLAGARASDRGGC
jgi:hypothetical protein